MKEYKNGIILYDEFLPRHILKGREVIWWEMCVGKTVDVEYKKIRRTIVFTQYETRYISYRLIDSTNEYTSAINAFYCQGGLLKNIFGDLSKEIHWKYNIGDIIYGRVHNVKIIDRDYRSRQRICKGKLLNVNEKWYKCECQTCGYSDIWIKEDRPHKDVGCKCCRGAILVNGKNDLSTTVPQIAIWLTDKTDMYRYTKGDTVWVDITCPECGFQNRTFLYSLVSNRYHCPRCSEGFSYPEKYMIEVLNEIGVKFIFHASNKDLWWNKNYIYDFYIPDKSIIIETQGLQHYKSNSWGNVDNVKVNDIKKKELAINNSIKYYIELDCRYSDPNYIQSSIENSILKDVYNLKDIDWNVCAMMASRNYQISVNQYWNQGMSIEEIQETLLISRNTIIRYLKQYKSLELNDYSVIESKRRSQLYKGRI